MPERPGESTPRLSSASRTMITSAGANSAPLRRTIRAFRARPNRVSAGRARSRRRHARTSIAAAAATPARISAAAAIPASPILSRAMIHEERSSWPIATISRGPAWTASRQNAGSSRPAERANNLPATRARRRSPIWATSWSARNASRRACLSAASSSRCSAVRRARSAASAGSSGGALGGGGAPSSLSRASARASRDSSAAIFWPNSSRNGATRLARWASAWSLRASRTAPSIRSREVLSGSSEAVRSALVCARLAAANMQTSAAITATARPAWSIRNHMGCFRWRPQVSEQEVANSGRCTSPIRCSPLTLRLFPDASRAQPRNEPRHVSAFDRLHVGGRQPHLAQRLDLADREIGVIRTEGDLRDRHELHQGRHGGRAGGVGSVVMQTAELVRDALLGERALLAARAVAVERLDAPGEHRDGAARMREQPLDVAQTRERAAEQQAGDGAGGVVRNLEHRREGADAELAAAGGDERMDIDHRLAPVELLEHRLVDRIAEPFVAVIRLNADAVSLQGIEGIFDFLEGRVDVDHRERREQAEAALVVAHHIGPEIVAGARHRGGAGGIKIEPGAGRGGEREHAGRDAALVELLDRLVARPGDLGLEMRNLAGVFPVEPRLLVGRRIEMMMGVDHLGARALRSCPVGRQQARRPKRAGAGQKPPPRDRRVGHGWMAGAAEAVVRCSLSHDAVSSEVLRAGA